MIGEYEMHTNNNSAGNSITKIGIYTGISDYTIIPAKMMKLFKPVSSSIDMLHDIFADEDENNICFTFKNQKDNIDLPPQNLSGTITIKPNENNIIFNIKKNKQFIFEHTVGMGQFYGQINSFKQQVQNCLLYQIKSFKEVVFCYFQKSEDKYKNTYIMKALFDIAKEAYGYIVMPDFTIYSPDKKIVFGYDGGSDYDEFIPWNYSEIDKKIDEEKLKNL